MVRKRLFYIFLTCLLTIYTSVLAAQTSLQSPGLVSNTVTFNYNFPARKDFPGGTIRRPFDQTNEYLKPSSLIIPGTLMIYGLLKPVINGIPKLDNQIMTSIEEHHAGFHTNAANYLMWAPSASVYAMDAFKVETPHTFTQHLALDAGSILLTGGFGYGMRIISSKIKVYKSDKTQFPSGHTANAFRGAEILHQELKDDHPVWSYSGYFLAAGVGILRMYTQQHNLSDVLTGAGLGIISTKLTYWVFQKLNVID